MSIDYSKIKGFSAMNPKLCWVTAVNNFKG
jgi:hypothetical protein